MTGIAHIIAEYDSLTGLYSRVMFEKTINRLIGEGNEAVGTQSAFILINVDGFKKVNDFFGHNVGDSILKTIAKIITQALPQETVLGRLGGDEFVGFVPGIESREAIEEKLKEINNNTRYEMDAVSKTGETLLVTTSIGLVFIEDNTERFHKLYPKANLALHQVKEAGKDGYRIYDNPL